MKAMSPAPAEQGESPLPFPVEQLPSAVIESYDRDQIGELLVEKMADAGIDPHDVVLTGFDAESLIENGGFGERSTTFGLVGSALFEGNDDVSPLTYLEQSYGGKPAVGVFYRERLVGGLTEDDLGEVSREDLSDRARLYIYWQTKDGASLDKAAARLFLF